MSRSGVKRRTTARASSAKPRGLTRNTVIDAGLMLLDKSGADAITMRGVADAIGATPMALYNHFSSKRDLVSAIAESVIGSVTFDGGQADWRERVRHCFDVLRALCLQHPGLPRLLEADGAAPASVFAPMEVTLRALHDAGLDDVDSVRTYFLLTGFTLAQAAYRSGRFQRLEPSEQIRTEQITVKLHVNRAPRAACALGFRCELCLRRRAGSGWRRGSRLPKGNEAQAPKQGRN